MTFCGKKMVYRNPEQKTAPLVQGSKGKRKEGKYVLRSHGMKESTFRTGGNAFDPTEVTRVQGCKNYRSGKKKERIGSQNKETNRKEKTHPSINQKPSMPKKTKKKAPHIRETSMRHTYKKGNSPQINA